MTDVPAEAVITKLCARIAELERSNAILSVQVELLSAPERPDIINQ